MEPYYNDYTTSTALRLFRENKRLEDEINSLRNTYQQAITQLHNDHKLAIAGLEAKALLGQQYADRLSGKKPWGTFSRSMWLARWRIACGARCVVCGNIPCVFQLDDCGGGGETKAITPPH